MSETIDDEGDPSRDVAAARAEEVRLLGLSLLGADEAAAAVRGVRVAARKILLENELMEIKLAEKRGDLISKAKLLAAIEALTPPEKNYYEFDVPGVTAWLRDQCDGPVNRGPGNTCASKANASSSLAAEASDTLSKPRKMFAQTITKLAVLAMMSALISSAVGSVTKRSS